MTLFRSLNAALPDLHACRSLIIFVLASGVACAAGASGEDCPQEKAVIRVDRPSADQAEWVLETSSLRWVLTFANGQFGTKSLINRKHSPVVEYSTGSVSPELNVALKSMPTSGPADGWARVPIDRKGVSYQITIDVKAGDRLIHMMKPTTAYLGSGIDWNPVIRYAHQGGTISSFAWTWIDHRSAMVEDNREESWIR